ncbi:MAG: GlxA family transcriptional regulator [Caulobacterales bacterium]|nr:GlxA family transcriptional regulator [Caulobacterales bacterium]
MTDTHRIVFFLTDGFQALDVFGPLDAFSAARSLAGCAYEWRLAAFTAGPVAAESGVKVLADARAADIGAVDTLVFVGGRGPRTTRLSEPQRRELSRLADAAGRIASVCTGGFLLAQLGIADGRTLATHWRRAREFADAFGDITVDDQMLFVRDGRIWSSAGITAGIDMAMAMIAEDFGAAAAASVARELVVYMRRPGNQQQFSEPLLAQSGDAGRMADVLAWAADNLSSRLSVDDLAARSAMSPRHFARVFRQATGMSPAHYVERLRLDTARVMLAEGAGRISQVAFAVGFRNPDSFRRAFERRFSISPSKYRAQFSC